MKIVKKIEMNLEAIYIIVMDSIRKEIFDIKVMLEYNELKRRKKLAGQSGIPCLA